MRTIIVCLTAFVAACSSEQQPTAVGVSEPETVVLFSADAEGTLSGKWIDDGVVPALKAKGYQLVALDPPCHDPGIKAPLDCWRVRIETGDSDIFGRYCRALSQRLNELGITEATAIGQSRGAYLAATCAALDPRYRRILMLKPVTDLQRLSEFDGYTVQQSVFGLDQYVPALFGRPIHIIIGARDTRVGTGAAVRFARLVGAEIDITNTMEHRLPEDGATAAWVLARLPDYYSSRHH